ncbi:TnsA-like heteromeric transposase endonuclease subunit [Streptomyces sp. NPDC096176]|uniref:TnsA-like heteromeric transposase endonuclease subunit n=1 Tax=Streptomyces sp. NPDC096176 TaxID=3366079 RepID=UPI0038237BEA
MFTESITRAISGGCTGKALMGEVVWAEFNSAAGRLRRQRVGEVHGEALETRKPVWKPVQYRGKRAIATWWRPAEAALHVGCAHLTALQTAQELEFDPQVASFAAWPVRLMSRDGGTVVVPDFFARLRSGQGCLVACPPVGETGNVQESAERQLLNAACEQAGWQLRVSPGPGEVVAANRRRLSRYRHPRLADAQAAQVLHAVFTRPQVLAEGIAASGLPRLSAMAQAHHLIWTRELLIDWERPFAPSSSPVWSATAVAR